MEIIDVTCAIIVRKRCVLACRRAEGSEHANQWEFPGGKIERGEAAEACMHRELKEELNIDVRLLRQLDAVIHEYSEKTIRLIPFLCEIAEGRPVPNEHSAVKWQPFDEFDVLNWSAADRKLFELNLNELLCLPY